MAGRPFKRFKTALQNPSDASRTVEKVVNDATTLIQRQKRGCKIFLISNLQSGKQLKKALEDAGHEVLHVHYDRSPESAEAVYELNSAVDFMIENGVTTLLTIPDGAFFRDSSGNAVFPDYYSRCEITGFLVD